MVLGGGRFRAASSAAVSTADWMSSASVSDTIWSCSDRVKGFSINVPISRNPNKPQTIKAVAGAVKRPSWSTRARGSKKHHRLKKREACRA